MNEEGKIPYSYHTFIYPFLYRSTSPKGAKKDVEADMDSFCKRLTKCKSLYKTPKGEDKPAWEDSSFMQGDDQLTEKRDYEYQAVQYFNKAAQKAILGADKNICKSFRLADVQNHVATYTIIEKSTYNLNISDIQLLVFNTGVALLVFETEFLETARYRVTASKYKKKGNFVKAAEAVKRINEFGRRLYPEYLPAEDCAICGKSLSIKIGEIERCKTDFYARKEEEYRGDPVWLPEIISKTLQGFPEEGTTDWVTSDSVASEAGKSATSKAEFVIEPAVDDRMFVCCCILDKQNEVRYMKAVGVADESGRAQRPYRANPEIAKALYALINIDAGDSSCQSFELCKEYLDRQLYTRWIDYGTVHAVTNHSMVCLTGEPNLTLSGVVNPFLILYVRLCCLTIAQRATLLRMDADITDAVSGTETDSGWDEVSSMEHRFAKFQGELMLTEVTPQIQGIEIYDKLQKMLFISKLEENLQKQLNNLYQIAEAKQQEAESENQKRVDLILFVLAVLSIISIVTDLSSYVYTLFNGSCCAETAVYGGCGGLGLIGIGILVFVYLFGKRKRGKKK